MFLDILLLLTGFILIIAGGNYVTEGSVAIAKRFKVSGLIIGLTVVAFGSSTPDLVVSVMSTIQGKSQLAIGGVVGAVIFDALLVVGICAMYRPIVFQRSSLVLDLPMLSLAALTILFVGADKFINGASADVINRSDGLVMLCIFALYMAYTILMTRSSQTLPAPQPSTPPTPQPAAQQTAKRKGINLNIGGNMWLASAVIVGGLVALVIGGNWIVDGASGLAKRAGWSEGLIGLTIVALGASLPDLATSLIAAIKGQMGIAIGNVLGACVIDLLLVLGVSSVISPLNAGTISLFDFSVLAGSTLLVWGLAALNPGHKINRWEGALLVLLYAGYMTMLIIRG